MSRRLKIMKRLLYVVVSATVIALGVTSYNYIQSDTITQELEITFKMILVIVATLSLLALVRALYLLDKKEREYADMKTDFVAVASHELRSPLTAIRWSLAALRSDATLQPNIREAVNDLYRKVCALIDLTSTFLLTTSADHGIMRTGDFKLFNLAQIIWEAIAHTQSIALMKKIKIQSDIEPAANILIKGDPERVRLVFDNLLSNAVKYSPESSVVSISYVDRDSFKDFKIHDQGIGIPKDELKQIFSGFHRASNARHSGAVGSGFGLYMAKKIVDFHGGKLACKSEVGHGTTFSITLPTGV